MLVFFIWTKPMRELHQPTYRLDSRIRNILTYLAYEAREGEYYLDRWGIDVRTILTRSTLQSGRIDERQRSRPYAKYR